MFRFLLTRRWLGLLLAVIVVGVACTQLGLWQLRRYSERQETNAQITANLHAAPAPVGAVLNRSTPPAADDEWRTVTATGRYDADAQITVLYRTRAGAPGVDVVVPLVTASGTAVLVDRGWVATSGNANDVGPLPAPPRGTVTVTGWVRRGAEGGSDETTPHDGTVRAISSDAIAEVLPYDVYDGFLQLTAEQPTVQPRPLRAPAPDLGSGPHFFYGLQWFLFAVLALGFWGYFAWTEYQQSRAAGKQASSERPGAAPVDRQHRAGDVAGRR